MTTDPVQSLLDRLEGVKPAGPDTWSARCPAHDDAHASLSVSRGDDGRALVHCHAGCTPEAICKAIGLELRDLFPRKAEGAKPARDGKAKGPGGAYHWTRDDLVRAGWALLKRDLSERIDAALAEGGGHD